MTLPVSASTLLALGYDGLALNAPEGVLVDAPRPVRTEPAAACDVSAALAEVAELARGKRRAAVLVGDVSLPGPYAAVLPALAKLLAGAGVRPTRIHFLACPGTCDAVLGRAAIRRYGEELTGEYEIRPWTPEADGLDAQYAQADLRLAVLPDLSEASSVLPEAAVPAWCARMAAVPGQTVRLAALRAEINAGAETLAAADDAAVCLTTGGGFPSDATLEEAVCGFRAIAASRSFERSAVLACAADEGLGSARFTRDLEALLREAEEALSGGDALRSDEAAALGDPAGELAAALCAWKQVVLYAPGLAPHEDGELIETWLAECPKVGARLRLAYEPDELWMALQAAHGKAYRLHAEPLGWRAR